MKIKFLFISVGFLILVGCVRSVFRSWPLPFFYVGLMAVGFLLALQFSLRSNFARVFVLNLMALPLAVSVAEGGLYLLHKLISTPQTRFEQDGDFVHGNYWLEDNELGYRPRPSGSYSAIMRERKTSQPVYNVRYGIDDEGLRKTYPSDAVSAKSCVVFFGCSFTFGEGLSDEESLPYLFGKDMGSTVKVYNLGFHGYGPHQMLAAIESGKIKKLLQNCENKPITAYFTTARFHIPRVAGKTFWDKSGPWYEVQGDHLTRRGQFSDLKYHFWGFKLSPTLEYQLEKSLTYGKLRTLASSKDEGLYLAIVKKSATDFANLFPKSQFKVIVWPTLADHNQKADNALVEKISQLGLSVTNVESILPDLRTHSARYELPDSHPSFEANRSIASFLSQH